MSDLELEAASPSATVEGSPLPTGPALTAREARGSATFRTTQWSAVRAAADPKHPGAGAAWDYLAAHYWNPLHTFARHSGWDVEAARDLTQGFFAHLLSGDLMIRADPSRGRFRTLLLGSFKNFLLMDARRQTAQKRGAAHRVVSLDDNTSDEHVRFEPVDRESPDILFERRWALQLIKCALDRLEAEVSARSNSELFTQLKNFLVGPEDAGTCAEIGAQFGMSEGAVKAAVHRLRQRYRALVREEIAATVASPSEIDEELRHVLAVLTG